MYCDVEVLHVSKHNGNAAIVCAPCLYLLFHSPASLASSTKMISLSRMAGEVCRTLKTVLRRVDQASLWKTMMTLVVGSGGQRGNLLSTHLCHTNQPVHEREAKVTAGAAEQREAWQRPV